tara:strand:- start:1638 stop:1820 length:183 start_codon:yes stop_codon:yes gene_type:complete
MDNQKGGKMKRFKLTDTSEQTIIYTCEVEANSEEEAIEKAENWEVESSYTNSNSISAEEK